MIYISQPTSDNKNKNNNNNNCSDDLIASSETTYDWGFFVFYNDYIISGNLVPRPSSGVALTLQYQSKKYFVQMKHEPSTSKGCN